MNSEFDFCNEQYFRELDRKASLTNALALPIGIGTLISSGMLFVAKSVGAVETRIELIVVGLIVAVAISLLVAIICLCKSYLGYTYQYVPTFSNLRAYRQSLCAFYKDSDRADSLSEAEAISYLLDKIISTTQTNFNNNNRKSGFIYLANRALVIALGFLLLAATPVMFSQFELDWNSSLAIIKGV